MTNENQTLSKSAQSVQHALAEKGLAFEVIELWAAAGTPNAVFSLSSHEIEALTHGKVIAIK